MREVAPALLLEQQQHNRKPVVKVEVNDYDFPVGGIDYKVRLNEYDWQYVHKNTSTKGIVACMTRNDTLIIVRPEDSDIMSKYRWLEYYGSNVNYIINEVPEVFRFEHPNPDTDFSILGTDGPPSYTHQPYYAITANPSSDEVTMFKVYYLAGMGPSYPLIGAGSFWYPLQRTSLDDGVTWGPWRYLWNSDDPDWQVKVFSNEASLSSEFGDFAPRPHRNFTGLTAASKPNGDMLLIASSALGGSLIIFERVSGVWAANDPRSAQDLMFHDVLTVIGRDSKGRGGSPEQGDEAFHTRIVTIMPPPKCGPGSTNEGPAPIMVVNPQAVWSPDDSKWLITYDKFQSNLDMMSLEGEQQIQAITMYLTYTGLPFPKTTLWWPSVLGFPGFYYSVGYADCGVWNYGKINLVAAGKDIHETADISSIGRDIDVTGHTDTITKLPPPAFGSTAASDQKNSYKVPSPFTQAAGLGARLRGWDVFKNVLIRQKWNIDQSKQYPYSSLHKRANHEIMLSVNEGGRNIIYHMRPDSNVDDGMYYKAQTFINPFPLKLLSTADYTLAISGQQIFISPNNDEWVPPTIGTGAGAGDIFPTNRVLKLSEQVSSTNPSTLTITLDNHDGYFDTPLVGTGSIEHIKRGSQITLSLGYQISGVDTYQEYGKYFLDAWEYTRQPNQKLFILHCTDGWGLLDNYTIPFRANWNEYEGAPIMYSIYDIIGLLIEAIGGSLTYTTRSELITNINPKMNISPNTNAGEIVRRLLKLVPDKLRFYGNNGVIINADETEKSFYHYDFPHPY
jgi:hypothetical protein